MKSIKAQFQFRPVGQGCFYTGKIQKDKLEPFHFVYDCGTDSEQKFMDREIQQYHNKITEMIDLVIISHFDMDHVNGLERLLKGKQVRRLVIPYCHPIERLFQLATYDVEDVRYYRMFKNLVEYFSGDPFNIKEIVVVGSPDDYSGTFPRELPGAEEMLEDDNLRLKFTDYFEKDSTQKFIDSLPEEEMKNSGRTIVKYYTMPYRFTIGTNDWEFVFYHKKGYKHDLVYRFTDQVKALIGEGSIEDLFDEEGINRIKKLYADIIRGEMNNTSLITYHALVEKEYHKKNYIIGSSFGWKYEMMKYATLLTGDAELDGPKKVKLVCDYFGSRLQDVACFQVPHHGAINNWKIKNKVNCLCSFPHYVANYGLKNDYGHPSEKVEEDIISNGVSKFHRNNEYCDYKYGYVIFHESITYTLQEDMRVHEPIKITKKLKWPK